jgi:hypothetical protein
MSNFPTKQNPQECRNGCGTEIYLSDKKQKGKWLPYELDDVVHDCPNKPGLDKFATSNNVATTTTTTTAKEGDLDRESLMEERVANFEKLLDLSGINLKLTKWEISTIVKGNLRDLVLLMLEMQRGMIEMDKWSSTHQEQDEEEDKGKQEQEGLN